MAQVDTRESSAPSALTPASGTVPTAATRWSNDELIPFGKYILLNKVSSGATAVVYRAKVRGEAGFERIVTIKRVLPQMAGDPEFVETFVREAKLCARLNHANICPIYELGKVGESLYMALQWVSGRDLGAIARRLAARDQVMPPTAAAWIASKLCDALDYAHGLKDAQGNPVGLLHQDLSPANVVISYEGEVKLLDFGIARATGRAQQTNVDALKQKLGYMSPEVVLGTTLDARSDVFGVGVSLYEMVTGKRLFAGPDDVTTLRLVSKAVVDAPSKLRDGVPEELESIILRALARDPEARWPSAGEMARALASYVAAENPTFGARNIAELLRELFEADIAAEQRKLHELNTASQDAQLMEQRRRFFASPLGAAAVAKAEAARRLAQKAASQDTVVTTGKRHTHSAAPPARTAATQAEPRAPIANSNQAKANDVQDGDDDALTRYRSTGNPVRTPLPAAVVKERKEASDAASEDEATTYLPQASSRTAHPAATAPAAAAQSQAAAAPAAAQSQAAAEDDEPTSYHIDALARAQVAAAPAGGASTAQAAAASPDTTANDRDQNDQEDQDSADWFDGLEAVTPAAAKLGAAPLELLEQPEEAATQIFFSAEHGIGLPDLPIEPPAPPAIPAPLRVPPPAGQAKALAGSTGRHRSPSNPTLRSFPLSGTGGHTPVRTPSAAPKAGSQGYSLKDLSHLDIKASEPPKPRSLRLHALWLCAGLAFLLAFGVVRTTAVGVALGLRKAPVGVIEVRTSPEVSADVRLDGSYRGHSPLRIADLPTGKHVLTIQAAGYEPVSRLITLEADAVVQEQVPLTRQPEPSAAAASQ